MVLFTFPVLLLAWAIRQRSGLVFVFDQWAVTDATGTTRAWDLASVAVFVQAVFHPFVVYVAATLMVIYAGLGQGLRSRALWAFTTMMVGWAIGAAAKQVVHRLRPVLPDPLTRLGGYSFPSGHALNITVATTALLFLFWPVLSPASRRLAVAGAVVLITIVGLDRIFLGVHFPSDVVAGYVLGFGITFSSWIAFVGPAAGISLSSSSARR
ncbi:phosphatase PAP2 family protein [Microlunatus ginsengisoli]|uniref:Phosphatidic acid phosphatase type 2/haloperoxidase domain-containing protein n=1 Tax=Microlunatus ginsengisoli TaxID=363863 RepID=A0ABP7AMG9_9ACTN